MTKAINKNLVNLMELIDEEEANLFVTISENILSYGVKAIPYLEGARDKSMDEIVHERIKKLINKIRIQSLYSELHNWATLDADDLLKGYFIVSKYLFPDLDEERVMAKVEALEKEVWLELKKGMKPFEAIEVVSKVFYEVRKFKLISDGSSMPDCLCLNALLNSNKAHPITHSVLFAGIAQSLDIPVYGVQLPDSIFLACVHSDNPNTMDYKTDVKFYLNPFAVGMFLSPDQHMQMLKEDHPKNVELFNGACTNQNFIGQVIARMYQYFILNNKTEKSADMLVLLGALSIQ
jgi:regulator of sirC expression with transglutaminase-like and TPR domain